ncbi:snRNA-activating protein complex subunit 1-like, partial [Dendronephthya gigantea]|uniref:snRNA-activating protein complex subunit 1-like n=1 Tax=Dendronephthya gigantea TaxID=151771 RepID=UPI00106DB2BD
IDDLTSDCRVLLARFEEKQNVRFETFCEVWKELKFSLIHHAGEHEWQKIQIVESLYRILGHYLTPSCPLQYQVGAIYSIYSVYHTQHVKPKVKIRMTLSMWNDFLKLQEYVREQKHYDIYYVMTSLRADKAFLFVAMPIQLACGSRDSISLYERDQAKGTRSSDIVQNTQEIIQKVNEIDALYNSAKMELCSREEGERLVDPVTLRVTSNDLVSNLQSDVETFETWKAQEMEQKNSKVKNMQRRPQLGLPEDRKMESKKQQSGQDDESFSRSQVVKEIKERSFKTVVQVSKGLRRHQPAPDSPDSPSPRRSSRTKKLNE